MSIVDMAPGALAGCELTRQQRDDLRARGELPVTIYSRGGSWAVVAFPPRARRRADLTAAVAPYCIVAPFGVPEVRGIATFDDAVNVANRIRRALREGGV